MSCVRQQCISRRYKSLYLDQQEQVGILALGGCPLALLDVMLGDIDTLAKTCQEICLYVAGDDELTILLKAGERWREVEKGK